jgi:hypothetical protein
MPQSTKDSKGGKSHSTKDTGSGGHGSAKSKKPEGRNPNSPTGSHKGEKKTTP